MIKASDSPAEFEVVGVKLVVDLPYYQGSIGISADGDH